MKNKKYHINFVIFYYREKFGWLGLGYLASALKKLNNITIDVSYYKTDNVDIACKEIAEKAPDFIGLSVLQTDLLPISVFTRQLKALLPNTHISMGNKEVTKLPEILMEWCPDADSVMIGESEYTIIDLVDRLMKKKDLRDCRGIYYRENGDIVKTSPRDIEYNIDNYEFPDREVSPPFIQNELVKSYAVITSRGCKGRCTFCVAEDNKCVRSRSMDKVFDEIEELVNHYSASYIVIGDSSFEDGGNSAIERYKEFLETIKKRNINFRFLLNSRAETINEELVGIMSELKKYGLDWINIGIEAGNENDLRIYGKRARLSDNYKALDLLTAADIPYQIYFIMFNPYSTVEGLRENIKLLYKYRLIYCMDSINSRFQTFSGARLTQKLFEDNLILDGVTYPIVEPYCYQFKEKKVQQIYHLLEQAIKIIDSPFKGQEIADLLSFVQWLTNENSPYKNDEKSVQLKQILEEYLNKANHSIFNIFNCILNAVEENELVIIENMEPELISFHEATTYYWKKMKLIEMKIFLTLKRNNKLPMRNHSISSECCLTEERGNK